MSLDRIKGEMVFICDMCDETLETGTADFREAHEARRRAGWGARQDADNTWLHACPTCPWNPRT